MSKSETETHPATTSRPVTRDESEHTTNPRPATRDEFENLEEGLTEPPVQTGMVFSGA
jgi:hypothetical protein